MNRTRIPAGNHEDTNRSHARAERVRGESRITACQSVAPLRFLQPRLSPLAAGLVISSYGGGFVQGDQISLRLECGENARLLVSTQGNGRVFRHLAGQPARQNVEGRVEAGAALYFLPDPLVLHANSRLHLRQTWDVHPEGTLLLADWVQSGRSDSGEAFAFQELDSVLEIRGEGRLLLREPFAIHPPKFPSRSAGQFGDSDHLLTLYAVGGIQDLLRKALEPLVLPRRERTQVPALADKPFAPALSSARSLVSLPDQPVTLFRALGKTRMDFDDIWEALEQALACDDALGPGTHLPCHRRPRSPDPQ